MFRGGLSSGLADRHLLAASSHGGEMRERREEERERKGELWGLFLFLEGRDLIGLGSRPHDII